MPSATPDTGSIYFLVIVGAVLLVFLAVIVCCCDEEQDRAGQPAAESAERRLARACALWQATAARAEALLAARAEAALTAQAAAEAPPVLSPLPYFPYAAAQGDNDKQPSETVAVECAICLEPLRPGQLCSEVPTCRHVFHGGCLGEWARSNGSCPLCRAKIVPGSDEVAVADDMV